ncbi:protein kinase [Actinoallomurus spadix]|uniref:serine/threonine-protein kinase n=1 Tax=Actinoallomurus spadix TaxID=79912 RepID=UPI00209365C1|nr:serine/threonine-protein kinase [Actinoallomurus spadix]MCO5986962.1 protein kinase [Actinoallomurus spadix]
MAESQDRLLSGRYRLIEEIGRGGMGVVWWAHDEAEDREVAVKEVHLPPSLRPRERENLIKRTNREAMSAGRLDHPGLIAMYDVVVEDDRPWLVMEYVAARSLEDVFAEDGPISPVRVADIGRQLLDALRAAHEAGIVHRDVKPSNVLLENSGRVVLTDFGIATYEGATTLTQSGTFMGSPAYVAPEVASGERASPSSDLWSLGATLYAAVEGRPPYDFETAMATLSALVTAEPDPPVRAGPLRPLLEGLLQKDPVRRLTAERAAELLAAATAPPLPSRPAEASRSRSSRRSAHEWSSREFSGFRRAGRARPTPPGLGSPGRARPTPPVLGDSGRQRPVPPSPGEDRRPAPPAPGDADRRAPAPGDSGHQRSGPPVPGDSGRQAPAPPAAGDSGRQRPGPPVPGDSDRQRSIPPAAGDPRRVRPGPPVTGDSGHWAALPGLRRSGDTGRTAPPGSDRSRRAEPTPPRTGRTGTGRTSRDLPAVGAPDRAPARPTASWLPVPRPEPPGAPGTGPARGGRRWLDRRGALPLVTGGVLTLAVGAGVLAGLNGWAGSRDTPSGTRTSGTRTSGARTSPSTAPGPPAATSSPLLTARSPEALPATLLDASDRPVARRVARKSGTWPAASTLTFGVPDRGRRVGILLVCRSGARRLSFTAYAVGAPGRTVRGDCAPKSHRFAVPPELRLPAGVSRARIRVHLRRGPKAGGGRVEWLAGAYESLTS